MTMLVDLRSDTVTRPSAAMRQAMADAEVGDDVFGEDPTVKSLEAEAAERLGFAAALFVPSGTMGNQIALHLLGSPGGEVVCGHDSHVFLYEMGAMAALSGLQVRTVPTEGGCLRSATVEKSLPPDAPYRSRTEVLVVENTANMAGGRVYSRAALEPLLALARRRGLATHLDGARIFNAAARLGVSPRELARGFDTVMFCLSKGLGAPVGSLLCGSADLIDEAWRVRKMFGGGMRQVGVLAAAGLVALHEGPELLAEDHSNARRLAEVVAELPGYELDIATVETNIVIFAVKRSGEGELSPAATLVSRLKAEGLLAVPIAADRVRLVTHRDLGPAHIDRAISVFRSLG
jgi:threonine aldolase